MCLQKNRVMVNVYPSGSDIFRPPSMLRCRTGKERVVCSVPYKHNWSLERTALRFFKPLASARRFNSRTCAQDGLEKELCVKRERAVKAD